MQSKEANANSRHAQFGVVLVPADTGRYKPGANV